ncbi:LOW QUALITY PROTEIN: nuclear receptor-interacting protein 2 [Pungitius pungitius]|uniref:LOW QUALITY PROTEIN: nuclear receptor-interacting protein 2 n=1 Tax=Pungitius pungitius TaxID=134920 RepID=UPI002E13DD11
MSEAKKGELALRDKAALHQQRRLKQATQFSHKDSADLLPLDGLKRLGTSKDLCGESDVRASIDTGSRHDHISSSCCRRLGLVPVEGGGGSVALLQLQLGRQTVRCSAHVTEDDAFELRLGLQTLLDLKCCLDLSTRVLKLRGLGEELPFLKPSAERRCQRDTNENPGS